MSAAIIFFCYYKNLIIVFTSLYSTPLLEAE